MKLNGLLDLGRSLPAFDELVVGLREGRAPAAPLAIYHAARPYLVAALAGQLDRPLLIITPRTNRARQWIDELRAWLPDEFPVHNFADPDALSYERIPWVAETRQRRLEALVGLLTWETSGAEERAEREAQIESPHDSPPHAPRSTLTSPRPHRRRVCPRAHADDPALAGDACGAADPAAGAAVRFESDAGLVGGPRLRGGGGRGCAGTV